MLDSSPLAELKQEFRLTFPLSAPHGSCLSLSVCACDHGFSAWTDTLLFSVNISSPEMCFSSWLVLTVNSCPIVVSSSLRWHLTEQRMFANICFICLPIYLLIILSALLKRCKDACQTFSNSFTCHKQFFLLPKNFEHAQKLFLATFCNV